MTDQNTIFLHYGLIIFFHGSVRAEYLPFSGNEFLHDSFSLFRTECRISIHRCHEDRGISVVLRLFSHHPKQLLTSPAWGAYRRSASYRYSHMVCEEDSVLYIRSSLQLQVQGIKPSCGLLLSKILFEWL